MPIAEAANAVIAKMEATMTARIDKLVREYSLLRTGRANPMILEPIRVFYYGNEVPLKQVAAISIPEARILEVRPWDPAVLPDIEKAILKSDLGVPPQNDGKAVRLVLPAMTEERRKDMVKVVRKMAEESRVTIRGDRRDAIEKIKKSQKAGEMSEDDVRLCEARIQKATDSYSHKIDDQAALKEKELLAV